MKVIPLSKAKAQLSKYARARHREPVVVTVNGVPSFQLTPIEEEDDLTDRLIATNAEFRKLLQERLTGERISIAEVMRRL